MKWRSLRRVLGVVALLLCSGYAVFAFIGITYSPNVPRSIVVDPKNNLCIGFEYNLGSGEFMYLFSYRCNEPLKLGDLGFPAQDKYIDMRQTMECPQYEIADKNGDSIQEIYITRNWPCKEFAHPWDNDAGQLAFTLASDGKFIDILQ